MPRFVYCWQEMGALMQDYDKFTAAPTCKTNLGLKHNSLRMGAIQTYTFLCWLKWRKNVVWGRPEYKVQLLYPCVCNLATIFVHNRHMDPLQCSCVLASLASWVRRHHVRGLMCVGRAGSLIAVANLEEECRTPGTKDGRDWCVF